jgi:hypothetical protein
MTTKERLMQELESASEQVLEATLHFVLTTKAEVSHQTQPLDSPATSDQSIQSPNGIQTLLDLIDSMPLSAEEVASLPHDGAENHDHYLYGAPKKAV